MRDASSVTSEIIRDDVEMCQCVNVRCATVMRLRLSLGSPLLLRPQDALEDCAVELSGDLLTLRSLRAEDIMERS